MQAVALHLLSTLVTYDSSTDLAAEVWQARLPQALLSSLVRDPEAVLLKMPGLSQVRGVRGSWASVLGGHRCAAACTECMCFLHLPTSWLSSILAPSG
jgi:hypothetical protein